MPESSPLSPPDRPLCIRCGNRGWYPECFGPSYEGTGQDYNEKYCDCPAGTRLRDRESFFTFLHEELRAADKAMDAKEAAMDEHGYGGPR